MWVFTGTLSPSSIFPSHLAFWSFLFFSNRKMTHTSSLPRFDLANHPPSETIKMMTGLLERITKTNDKLQANSTVAAGKRSAYTCFHARSIPSIDIYSYLNRILKYCPCTNECFLSLLVYFDRMSRNSTGLRIDSFNVHRLVISGIMVASKFFSDIFFTNARYAKVRMKNCFKQLPTCRDTYCHVIGFLLIGRRFACCRIERSGAWILVFERFQSPRACGRTSAVRGSVTVTLGPWRRKTQGAAAVAEGKCSLWRDHLDDCTESKSRQS